jgi:hypothetical protein
MNLQEIVVMIHQGEYGRAISSLEFEVANENKPPTERIEYCKWLAECNERLQDRKASGDAYLQAVKLVLGQQGDQRAKARQALPMCEKALEAFRLEGDSADVLMAARLKVYLKGLDR